MFRRFALAVVLLATTVAPAAATPFPSSIPLPVDFQPEGVAVGTGSAFYVGSLTSGDIYRGDLRSGAGGILVDAPPGRVAVGLKVEESRHRLWVAGGPTGHAYVYDTRDGTTVADIPLSTGSTLLNDVVVTRHGAYFTDSFQPALYEVPIAPDGSIGTPRTIAVSGPAATIVAGQPNLNGIAATADGSVLIVGHTPLGAVLTVDPATGASRTIEVTGGTITPGTPDGLLLLGHSLWVMENFAERLVEIRLSPDLTHGTFGSVITSDLFRVPTTIAVHGDDMVAVNGRFDVGFPPPFGPGAPPGTDFDVVLVPRN